MSDKSKTFVRWMTPGIWEDADGNAHIDFPTMLRLFELEDTAENREAMMAIVQQVMKDRGFPAAMVIYRPFEGIKDYLEKIPKNDPLTAIDLERLAKGMCPDCLRDLVAGPRGGAARNMLCYYCRSRFNTLPGTTAPGFNTRLPDLTDTELELFKQQYPPKDEQKN